MQDKKTKQEAALSRLENTLKAYKRGEWNPSKKDKARGTTLQQKIKRCEMDIEYLTDIINNT